MVKHWSASTRYAGSNPVAFNDVESINQGINAMTEQTTEATDQPKVKGRRSYVLKGESKGGNVFVRMDADVHRRLAEHCKDAGVSISKYAAKVIEESLPEGDR